MSLGDWRFPPHLHVVEEEGQISWGPSEGWCATWCFLTPFLEFFRISFLLTYLLLPVNFLGLILCSAVLSNNKLCTGFFGYVSFHGCTSCYLGGKLVCGFFRFIYCLHLLTRMKACLLGCTWEALKVINKFRTFIFKNHTFCLKWVSSSCISDGEVYLLPNSCLSLLFSSL